MTSFFDGGINLGAATSPPSVVGTPVSNTGVQVRTEYVVEGLFGGEESQWEIVTYCDSKAEALEERHDYRLNNQHTPFRIRAVQIHPGEQSERKDN